jgi:hypothetical protein
MKSYFFNKALHYVSRQQKLSVLMQLKNNFRQFFVERWKNSNKKLATVLC